MEKSKKKSFSNWCDEESLFDDWKKRNEKKNSFLPLIYTDSKRKLVLAYGSSPLFSYSLFFALFLSFSRNVIYIGLAIFASLVVQFILCNIFLWKNGWYTFKQLITTWTYDLRHKHFKWARLMNKSTVCTYVYFLLAHSTFNWW